MWGPDDVGVGPRRKRLAFGARLAHSQAVSQWIKLLSDRRLGDPARPPPPAGAPRTTFQRDYDRVVFCTAFRRLVGKTQVFPLPDNDLVHSRLTHSLEVSCVGRSLGSMVGQVLLERHPALGVAGHSERSFGDIVAAACLAHDIGNPPFGHAGEDAIGRWFRTEGADLLAGLREAERLDLERFEGNAQGFRVLTRLQIPSNPGLKLTQATLAAFTKYPRGAGPKDPARPWKKHGYFQTEAGLFRQVAEGTGLAELAPGVFARHPLASLVEAADDICYSILDLEDGFRLGLTPYADTRDLLVPLTGRDRSFRLPPLTHDLDEQKEQLSYLRAKAINALAHEVMDVFLDVEQGLLNGTHQQSLTAALPAAAARDALLAYTRRRCYRARTVVEIELAGYEVLSQLLTAFAAAALAPHPDGKQAKLLDLLPPAAPTPAEAGAPDYLRLLRVTDYLSGMSDAYAVSLFRRLKGIHLPAHV